MSVVATCVKRVICGVHVVRDWSIHGMCVVVAATVLTCVDAVDLEVCHAKSNGTDNLSSTGRIKTLL